MKKITLISFTLHFLAILFWPNIGITQNKKFKSNEGKAVVNATNPALNFKSIRPSIPVVNSVFENNFTPKSIAGGIKQSLQKEELSVVSFYQGRPAFVEGKLENAKDLSLENQVFLWLSKLSDKMGIKDVDSEFKIESSETDALGYTHFRVSQYHGNAKVYYGNLIFHAKDGEIVSCNGHQFPTTTISSTPSLNSTESLRFANADLEKKMNVQVLNELGKKLTGSESYKPELLVYHASENKDRSLLVWHHTIFPNVVDRWEYFVDANSGAIIHSYHNGCKIHAGISGENHSCDEHHHHHMESSEASLLPPDGPAIANASDLAGVSRSLNTYQLGNLFYLMDGSRPMFNLSQSKLPNDPVGALLTLNGNNTSPESSNNFNVTQFTSNNNSWSTNQRVGVSAHYNAGKAYEYFKNTFNRNSINGKGGTVFSLVNIAEANGSGMDNAFWNGQAMFYGNGSQAFTPLARSLDVAGHEMSHGVIQNTADLEYQGESGAINESYADIFGCMIDRDDWRLGEEVVKTSFFPSGALRDMSNPYNGGTKLGDNGYQPKLYTERYIGSQDNGGVHINSGIGNYTFFLFASNASIGRDKAEQVFYRALTTYLVKSSKYIDLRLGVVKSAKDLYGDAAATLAENAFITVKIGGGSTGGGGSNPPPPNTYQNDLPVNPGADFILMTSSSKIGIQYAAPGGTPQVIWDEGILSRPSVSEGYKTSASSPTFSDIVWVGDDNKMYYMTINWTENKIQDDGILQGDPVWRNVVISKDGNRIAALRVNNGTFENKIYVYDFVIQQGKDFTLYNPTTANGGNKTGDVQYADALDWEHSGRYLIYDAYNKLGSSTGTQLEYWDIGILDAFDPRGGKFNSGEIDKLFNDLEENTSIGNPTFSKNSPYIVAFDYLDEAAGTNYVLGVNIQNGKVGSIYENSGLGWPSFSRTDNSVIIDNPGFFGTSLITVPLKSTKIEGNGNPATAFSSRRWGVWSANGTRVLSVSNNEVLRNDLFEVLNNPVANEIQINWTTNENGDATLKVFDLNGKLVTKQVVQIGSTISVPCGNWSNGIYFVRIESKLGNATTKILKQ
jgi:bacillolysin